MKQCKTMNNEMITGNTIAERETALAGEVYINDVKESVTPSAAPKAAPLATEAGHWYMQDGSPFYTIKGKNGNERPVTLRDARNVFAVPSVTTITKEQASPGLQKYFERQIFSATIRQVQACLSCGDVFWDDDEGMFDAVRAASREDGKAAADKGTALHGAIERHLSGQDCGEEWREHVFAVIGELSKHGISMSVGEAEKSFAHGMGFGGKVDYHERLAGGLVIDFKSKPNIVPGKRYGYDNHAMQLAAYSMGLGMAYARGINVFVGIEDKQVMVHEWTGEELSRGWSMFSLLLKFWQVAHNYFPRCEIV